MNRQSSHLLMFLIGKRRLLRLQFLLMLIICIRIIGRYLKKMGSLWLWLWGYVFKCMKLMPFYIFLLLLKVWITILVDIRMRRFKHILVSWSKWWRYFSSVYWNSVICESLFCFNSIFIIGVINDRKWFLRTRLCHTRLLLYDLLFLGLHLIDISLRLSSIEND